MLLELPQLQEKPIQSIKKLAVIEKDIGQIKKHLVKIILSDAPKATAEENALFLASDKIEHKLEDLQVLINYSIV